MKEILDINDPVNVKPESRIRELSSNDRRESKFQMKLG